jgi:hypothetical protein
MRTCLGAVSCQKVALGLVSHSPCEHGPEGQERRKCRVYDGVGRLKRWFCHVCLSKHSTDLIDYGYIVVAASAKAEGDVRDTLL